MRGSKTSDPPSGLRGTWLRAQVLDAAESLLRDGRAEFTMRELAAAAEVSFATPFNQFGSKAGIIHALSARRIEAMVARFDAAAPAQADAAARVLLSIDLAAGLMLEEPTVNRAVMGWLGTAGPAPGGVLENSKALWAKALGAGEGLDPSRRDEALRVLPERLAFIFRGALSFWTAGDLPDRRLAPAAREAAQDVLLAFSPPGS